jgi:hypothetical protein
VGLAEVTGDDRPVDRADDLAEQDLGRFAGEHVAAADPALGAHDARALEREEDLLEVGLGQAGAVGDLAHGGRRAALAVERERQQRSARIVAAGRDLHSAAS